MPDKSDGTATMTPPVKGVKLASVQLAIEGDARCPRCGSQVARVDIPLLVESSIPLPPGQVTLHVRAGSPVQRPCGHELPVASRVVASIRHDEPDPAETEGQ